MLFNSLEFLIFFIVVTSLYFVLPHRFRWLLLLLASCVFYMAFIPAYILILLVTIVIDYLAGIYIEKAEGIQRKRFLAMSIIANVGMLAVFKYFNFFIDNTNTLLAQLHIVTHPLPFLSIILPLGLSFHTFQAMSYTIEVYRGHQKAERHFGIYALYVMFYPQLVAGPIERPQNLLHQFYEEHHFSYEDFLNGLRLMLWGLFKKAVIADRLSSYADAVFKSPQDYHGLQTIIGVLGFAIQIYCDFSGYSDMAIGSARCMGFKLMTNFKRPYFASSIKEFWAKWHISLSTWFRDYLYFTLGGNRVGTLKMYRNIAVVFLISGLWHGANWTFVMWGAIHGFFNICNVVLERNFKRLMTSKFFLLKPLGWLLTFTVVLLAWIFFRAHSFDSAWYMLGKIFSADTQYALFKTVKNFGSLSLAAAIGGTIYMFIVERFTDPRLDQFNHRPAVDLVFCICTLLCIVCLGVFSQQTFIYFQF
jgi:alginate O-acetyltransferase complex protein AlgI